MYSIIIIIFSAISFIIFEIIKRKVLKELIKKEVKITKFIYITIDFASYMLAGLAVTIFIIFTYAIPKEEERIEKGKECCLNMNGEIIGKKCKFEGIYMEENEYLYELANPGNTLYHTYCKKNEKQ